MLIIMWFVFGLFFGSFVNALVWRIREQQVNSKKSQAKDLSILHGRSMCPHCRHKLSAKDLAPVISWISLRGKCRYCNKPIHWQYPAVELSVATLFALSFIVWPESTQVAWLAHLQFATWLVLLTGLVALIVYDIRWMLLPDRIVLPLMGVASVLVATNTLVDGWQVLLETLYAVLIAGGIFYLIYRISDGKWIGGGDITLGVLIGLMLQDPLEAFLMLLFASIIGTIFILPGLILKKITVKSRIPFGPFLIISAIFVMFWGERLISWYKQTLLGL